MPPKLRQCCIKERQTEQWWEKKQETDPQIYLPIYSSHLTKVRYGSGKKFFLINGTGFLHGEGLLVKRLLLLHNTQKEKKKKESYLHYSAVGKHFYKMIKQKGKKFDNVAIKN